MQYLEERLKRAGIFLFLFLSAAAGASAATLTVSSSGDATIGAAGCTDGCSLREAINSAAPNDTIAFSAIFNQPQIITLTQGQLTINKNLTINGTGANLLTVSGGGTGRVFFINSGVTVVLNKITVTGGAVTNGGGAGIENFNGNLTLTNVTVTGNSATSNVSNFLVRGGGIANDFGASVLTLTSSTVSFNTAARGGGISASGGGIYNGGGAGNIVTITNSTVSGNSATDAGGGIDNNGGQLNIDYSTIADNQTTGTNGSGGGLHVSGGTSATHASLFADNTAANGADVSGPVTSQNYNLISNSAGSSGFNGPNDLLNAPADIAPLGNYGGDTMTHALQRSFGTAPNFTIDRADPNGFPAVDQRGAARPQIGMSANRADIGSFELGNERFALPSGKQFHPYYLSMAPNAANYTYCLVSGQLPPGIEGFYGCAYTLQTPNHSLPQQAVELSGTPAESGTYNFTVNVISPQSSFVTIDYSLTIAPQACTPPPPGMVGWYPGDNSPFDLSQTHNNAAMVNGATYAAGKVSAAFFFDGVDDYVQAVSNAAQDPATTATLDAWVYFNQTPSVAGRNMEIISKGSFNSDFDLLALTDNKFYFYVGGGINVASTTVVQPNVWYHVAGTWDSTGLRMYVNGALENTKPQSALTRNPDSTRPLTIGNGTEFDRNQRWFSGLIDEAEIFSRALSQAEIQAIYDARDAGKCKNTTAAGVTVGGRVMTAGGRGIAGARVTLTDQNAASQTTLTNAFGFYRFDNVTAGALGIFAVSAKKYSFMQNPRVQTMIEDVSDLDFVADK